jgi:tetratricopeptide (TPR) repeat protein
MLTTDELLQRLEETSDLDARNRLLEQEAQFLTIAAIQQIKTRANQLLNTNVDKGLALAENIRYASVVSDKPIFNCFSLMVQANAYRRRGNLHEAIVLYDQARDIALQENNPVEAARSQVGKIGTLMLLQELDPAIALARETAEILLAHGETLSAASALLNAGTCLVRKEQYEEAIVEFSKAQSWITEIDSQQAEIQLSNLHFNVANAYYVLGRYSDAYTEAEKAVAIAAKYNMTINQAIYSRPLSDIHWVRGDYNRTLQILYDGAEVFKLNRTWQDYAYNLETLILCYIELGRYEDALEQAQKLFDIKIDNFQKRGTPSYLTARYFMGYTLYLVGRTDEALPYLQEVFELAQETGDQWRIVQASLSLAQIYQEKGATNAAIECLKQGITLSKGANLPRTIQASLMLAQIEAEQDSLETALARLESAMNDAQKIQADSLLSQGFSQFAAIHEKRGAPDTALDYLRRSIQTLEQQRGRIAAQDRVHFLRSKSQIYESAVHLLLAQNEPEQAFNMAERVKSRALVEMVGQQIDLRVRSRTAADTEIVAQIEKLRTRHNEITGRLARWKPGSDLFILTPQGRQKLETELAQIEKTLAELTDKLHVKNADYTENPVFAPQQQNFDPSGLDADQALIEYFMTRDELVAFVVTRQGVTVRRGLANRQALQKQLIFFRHNLGTTVKSLAEATTLAPGDFERRLGLLLSNSQALLGKLYNILLAPLAPELAPYRRLIIVPHGTLHYVPFGALYNSAAGRYLVESFDEISYLPSANLLKICRERRAQTAPQGTFVLGFSNQGALPFTVKEAQAVADTLGCRPCLEKAATLSHLRETIRNRQIVHLATHGRYREDAPMFSSLLLADGELTGYEIFNLDDLNASLVTLSACDSGLGAIGGGDEVLGLSRAYLYAGAQSLVLALWRVEDEASASLMQEFYRNLLAGQTKAAALRQAQLALLANPVYRHPFYWATFVLLGDPGVL